MKTQPAEKFARDLRALVNDTEELIKATADHANERVVSARAKAAESFQMIQASLAPTHSVDTDNARLRLRSNVHDNAWKLAGIAAGAGLLIGLLFGRPPRR